MAEKSVCSSCKKRVTNTTGTTKFLCPKCGDSQIIRCFHCRETAIKYKCDKCGFEGPN
tara:strand:+ start:4424 stop:4597 length:174 start_codon:yes stop_codon:yes gene_type:complete